MKDFAIEGPLSGSIVSKIDAWVASVAPVFGFLTLEIRSVFLRSTLKI